MNKLGNLISYWNSPLPFHIALWLLSLVSLVGRGGADEAQSTLSSVSLEKEDYDPRSARMGSSADELILWLNLKVIC